MDLETFDSLCQRFAADNRSLLRPKGLQLIAQAQEEGADVLIVSASIDNWVQPFFPHVKVLGTQIEVKDGCLTGRFHTKNCYGQEKVNRILALYPDRNTYHLTAYGDSRGDKELLAFAAHDCSSRSSVTILDSGYKESPDRDSSDTPR